MNKELRELFDENHLITKKITLKNNVRIISTKTEDLVIKKKNSNSQKIYDYLSSRSFNYYPNIIYETNNYEIYEYVNDVEMPSEQRAVDMIKLVALLHNKTTFHKEIDDDTYKTIYEDILEKIEYLRNYYNDLAEVMEKEEYMSPSNYLLLRNITKIFQALNYCQYNIEKWYDIIEEKKRVRIVHIHNNLELDHYRLSDKPYLISWHKSKRDMPIYDLINMYKKYYFELDFCDLLNNYERNYPLLKEEKILFFTLISIPEKLEFNDYEYNMCIKVKKLYNYLLTTEKLISDYLPKEQNV